MQLVQAQVAETFGPRARAFGWNGQAALLEAWNRQRGTQQRKRNFYDGFAVYYRAGLTGENMDQVSIRYTWMLTEPQKQAAYRAGRQDAAAFAARGRVTEGLEENFEEGLDPPQKQGIPAKSDGQDGVLTSKQTDSILDTGGTSESARPLNTERVKQTMTAQVEALPEEHRQALQSYTGSAAFRINSAIRSGKITPEIQREIDLLDAALKDGVMPETVVLHRDTALSFLGLGLSEKPTAEGLSKIVDRTTTNDIFTSTSFNNLGFMGRNTELWLTVPAGYRGCRYIKSLAFPKYAYQEEVLFARGLRYRITEAKIENGKYVLFAEVLP